MEKTLDGLLDVFAEKHLPDFGYVYVQFDNCYQIGNGSSPENFLTWNPRYPGGAEYAIKKIRQAGMKPGIWVHRVHRPTDPGVRAIAEQHPEWFVHKADGTILYERGFYSLNTHNKDAAERVGI